MKHIYKESKKMNDFGTVENLSPAECEIFQAKLLHPLISDIIQFTPAFEQFKNYLSIINESNSIGILRRLPLLSKNDLMLNIESFKKSNIQERLYEVKTGGTSGERLVFERMRSEYKIENKFVAASWSRLGIKLGEDKGVVLSSRVAPRSEDGFSFVDKNNMLWLACNHQSTEHWVRIYEAIVNFKPKYVRGYGSLVSEFFRQLMNQGLSLPKSIIGIAYSSDPMTSQEINFISENFCDNIISLYGQTERVTMGVTCEKTGKFHLYPDYGFTELVRDDGTVIDTPGEFGEIVGTSLFPRATSLLRYRTGDMACWSEHSICECGRQMPTLEKIIGRSQEILITKSGDSISLGRRTSYQQMMQSLPIGTGIQFTQRTPGHLHAFIQSQIDDENKFYDAINHLSDDFHVTYEIVKKPILHSNGKRTLIV